MSILSPYKEHAFASHVQDQLNSLSQDCNTQFTTTFMAEEYNREIIFRRKLILKFWVISTYPRVDNDLLIFAASFSRSPSAPDVLCLFQVNSKELGLSWAQFTVGQLTKLSSYLSDPARSTRFSLANRKLDAESFSHLLSMIQVKTLWERLLSRFIFVAATFLFAEPWSRFWASAIF